MNNIDNEWLLFLSKQDSILEFSSNIVPVDDTPNGSSSIESINQPPAPPTPSPPPPHAKIPTPTPAAVEYVKPYELIISTKTKVLFLSKPVDIFNIFWKIPIVDYWKPEKGVIKKQIKIVSKTKTELEEYQTKLVDLNYYQENIIKQIDNPNSRSIKFKDERKITVGMSKKDITVQRSRVKNAFYNCMALILRFKYEDVFKEIHVKVFNTGKMEIPGIVNYLMLQYVKQMILEILQLYEEKEKVDTFVEKKENVNEEVEKKENVNEEVEKKENVNEEVEKKENVKEEDKKENVKEEDKKENVKEEDKKENVNEEDKKENVKEEDKKENVKEEDKKENVKEEDKEEVEKKEKEEKAIEQQPPPELFIPLHFIDNFKEEHVLINSNFNCGYFINRERFYNILISPKYGLEASFDPCNYSGVKCRYYFNNEYELDKTLQKGVIMDKDKRMKLSDLMGCKVYTEVSLMIFRTGSCIIVGNCSEKILRFIFEFIKEILVTEYKEICFNNEIPQIKNKSFKMIKRNINVVTGEIPTLV